MNNKINPLITYRNKSTGKYIKQSEIKNLDNPQDPDSGEEIELVYEKMSKSK